MDHCITAPVRSPRNLFLESREVAISRSMTEKRGSPLPRSLFLESREVAVSRSMTEKRGSPLYDLKLDKLSKREKVSFDLKATCCINCTKLKVHICASMFPTSLLLLAA